MQKRINSRVPAMTVCLFAAGFALVPGGLFAAGDCLEQPSSRSSQASHWYYHLDRASGRKCWHLAESSEPAAKPPQVEMPPVQPAPEAARQPSFSSFFAPLTSAFSTASTGAPEPDNRGVALAQPPSSKSADATPPKRRQRADAKPRSGSLDQADRDLLFQEYLRWRERQ